jgi:hypothetical protein
MQSLPQSLLLESYDEIMGVCLWKYGIDLFLILELGLQNLAT